MSRHQIHVGTVRSFARISILSAAVLSTDKYSTSFLTSIKSVESVKLTLKKRMEPKHAWFEEFRQDNPTLSEDELDAEFQKLYGIDPHSVVLDLDDPSVALAQQLQREEEQLRFARSLGASAPTSLPPSPPADPFPPAAGRSQPQDTTSQECPPPLTEAQERKLIEVGALEDGGELFCPISHRTMCNPVTALDGKTYEKKSIDRWIATKRQQHAQAQSNPPGNFVLLSPVNNTPIPQENDGKYLLLENVDIKQQYVKLQELAEALAASITDRVSSRVARAKAANSMTRRTKAFAGVEVQ